MQKSFIIVIAVSLGTIGALYSLPKVVVSDEKKTLEQTNAPTANRDQAPAAATPTPDATDSHGSKLTAEQQQNLDKIRATYAGKTDTPSQLALANSLIETFVQYTRYDSAAYYAEKIALLNTTETTLLKAADLYYEAFTYALDNAKTATMGEKARALYQQVLDKNPNNLMAKTNMAMTFVSSPNPMQGILMLREVIAKEPEFEPALFNLGILSIRSNQFGKAVERFKQILKINPANSKAALNLGYCLAELDRKDEAKQILEKVLANTKDPQEKAAANEILSKLK